MTNLTVTSVPKITKEIAGKVFDSYLEEEVSFTTEMTREEFIEINYLYDEDIHYEIRKDNQIVGNFGLRSRHFTPSKKMSALTMIKNFRLVAMSVYVEERLKLGDLYVSYLHLEPVVKDKENLLLVLDYIEKLAQNNGAFRFICLDCYRLDDVMLDTLLEKNYVVTNEVKNSKKEWLYLKKKIIRGATY